MDIQQEGNSDNQALSLISEFFVELRRWYFVSDTGNLKGNNTLSFDDDLLCNPLPQTFPGFRSQVFFGSCRGSVFWHPPKALQHL